jgi:PAS domain S-box-containing protein
MQIRNHVLTVAAAIMLASIIFSGVLLKNNLEVVKNSKASILIQQINAQELSTSLGNLQLNVNRYIIFRQRSTLDSIRLYEKKFLQQSEVLYKATKQIPLLKEQGEIIHAFFPQIIKDLREKKFKSLPLKITTQNVIEVFDENSNPFSIIWIAIDHVRSYQIKTIKTRTTETIEAGSHSWKVSVLGSLFMLIIVLWGCIYISKSYKKREQAEAKEIASDALRKENEKLLQAVIDNCTALIFIKDRKKRYTLVNKSFVQMLQLSNEEIIGKSHDEVFKKIYPEHISGPEDRVLNFGEIKESTEIFNQKERTLYYLTTKFPLYGAAGEIFGLGGISTDITPQREYENELTNARALAEAAKMSQQRFLANMSHEIRTPMNGVIGMTNLLDSTSLNPEQADYVNVIRQSSNILMLLINDILDVSKMQAGMLKLEKIPFEVRESIKQIFLSYKPLADEMGISLHCEVDDSTPEFLLGDPLRLNQIISNLVNNAIKFTSVGSVKIKVTAAAKEAGMCELKVEVSDTGIGIREDKLGDVFKSFTQSSTSTTRKYGGTGLGLAIVKELVEMQNGTVSLTSELNSGSTFTVFIPFAVTEMNKSQQQKSKSTQKFASLKNKKMLVVEDNLINQKVARQILLKAGFEAVDIADNGYKALELLQQNVYDAVLMDVQMPEMDGMETTRRIRNDLNLTVPVIALTASALPEDREICLNAGMNEYVTKPFLPEDLLQKLSSLLQ